MLVTGKRLVTIGWDPLHLDVEKYLRLFPAQVLVDRFRGALADDLMAE